MPDFWTFKMAWRLGRGRRRRLLLYLSSMALGVAALVALQGFGTNLTRAVGEEAKTLLGADLQLERERPLSDSTQALVDSLAGGPGAETARRVSFPSMATFPGPGAREGRGGGTRLASVRAVEPGYPFYGQLTTDPPQAAERFRSGGALVDGSLLQQFGAGPGDSVRIGDRTYAIAGRLEQSPGATATSSMASPRVFVPYGAVDTTLLARGSRAEYETYLRLPDDTDLDLLADELRMRLEGQEVRVRTPGSVADDWQAGVQNLYRFLGLVGFAALLLGGLGVASAMNVYVKKEIETVAVLRCLGAKGARAFRVFLVQAAALGLAAAALGAVLGVGVQLVLPDLLGGFLPVSTDFEVSWAAVGWGLVVGTGAALLFALLPLLRVRGVSPMRALRAEVENGNGGPADRWLRGGVWALIAVGMTGFSVLLAPDWRLGLGYAGGVIGVFALLALLAAGIVRATRAFQLPALPYPWRQGLANLHRPGNQTRLLIGVLGFGTFLVLTLLLAGRTLRKQLQVADQAGRPNVVLFDVQSDQVEDVAQAVWGQNLPVLSKVPLVPMELDSVKGRSIEAIKEAGEDEWAHSHDFRATYRDHLIDSERIAAGTFVREERDYGPGDAVPVSVEQDMASDLGVALGDTLTFDVQGVPVKARVASLRNVDWKRVQTNFFMVFPPGALEEAPTSYAVLSRAESEAASAGLQQAVAQQFPNVLAIDLSLVLKVFDRLFGQLAQVMRFMALFSVLTGLVVLAGAVSASRYRRAEESVLLKTLGGRRRQVFQIMLAEHLLLGLLAAVAGLAAAVAAAWALAQFVFEAPLALAPRAMTLVLVAVPALTAGIGLYSSRGLYARPPMEVLRVEAG